TGSSEILLTPIHEKGGKKAVVIPISATEAYVAEVRGGDGLPEAKKFGVLLYRVSLTARREGFLRVIAAAPDDLDPTLERRFVALYNALYTGGVVLDDEATPARIEIIERVGKGFRLRVTR
ncbi:MAG: hypothetical protein H7145_05170, partial [Akkermansiaceae bacterium]|nr:hypothetical protein [Armatimonadota bacterium]